MQQVKVDRHDLLGQIVANRDSHRKVFLDALAGWQQRVIAQLEIAVEDAKTGRNYTTSLTLPKPVDHTSDYDQAIAMLKMEVSASVKIDNRTFSQLVMDDWGWKEDFLSTASLYLEHN